MEVGLEEVHALRRDRTRPRGGWWARCTRKATDCRSPRLPQPRDSSRGAPPTSREQPRIYWATSFPLCPQRDSVLALASGNKFSFRET